MEYICRSSRGQQEILGSIAQTEQKDLASMLLCSQKAFLHWSQQTINERIRIVSNFLDQYKLKRNHIANCMSKEIGKPITQALADIDYDI